MRRSALRTALHNAPVGTIRANSSKLSARGRRERRVIWGLFVGVTLAFVLYSFYEEWQQRWLNKKRLADMRKNFKASRSPF